MALQDTTLSNVRHTSWVSADESAFAYRRRRSLDLEAGTAAPAENASRQPSIQNIEIPSHLLATASVTRDWTPDSEARRYGSLSDTTNADENFNIARIAQQLRTDVDEQIPSPSAGGLSRSNTFNAGNGRTERKLSAFENRHNVYGARAAWRKTSLPTLKEMASRPSMHSAESASPNSSFASKHDFMSDESVSNDTMLFKELSSYDLSAKYHGRSRELSSPENAAPDVRIINGPIEGPPDVDIGPMDGLKRSGTRLSFRHRPSIIQEAATVIATAAQAVTGGVANVARRTSIVDVYEKAKVRGAELQRKRWVQILFEYSVYAILLAFIYFVLIGVPLWKGAVWWLYWVVDHKFVVAGTWSITIGMAILYAFSPLLILFEQEPPMPENPAALDPNKTPGVHNTALLIPCYKSAKIIGPTLQAAINIFPAHHIYVIANGNSPTPLDNTEEVCRPFGVNHIWSPVGSKIVAQFVGCYAARKFTNVLLIDDDCSLPPNFPIASDRMKGNVKCIGYTIKSAGPNSSKGTLCQQAQDLEYKISGLQRALAGKIGSATFPHGAISLWDTEFLIKTFHTHPGFSVSEDWFFGHVARQLGCRIKMCTAIFVETETPSAVFFPPRGGARGGFGEMTIFKQRFFRWNFFFVNGMYYNMAYILGSWKLGWWELGTKLFVLQEVYETLLYLLAPFVLPISLIVRPVFCVYLLVATFGLYYINATIFNEVHLRLRNERVGWVCMYLYYMPYKIVLTAVNVASCYYALFNYAKYFAKRHPKVIEDEKAVDVVVRLAEQSPVPSRQGSLARRMTVTAIGTRLSVHSRRLSSIAAGARDRRSVDLHLQVPGEPRSAGSANPNRSLDLQRQVSPGNMAAAHAPETIPEHPQLSPPSAKDFAVE